MLAQGVQCERRRAVRDHIARAVGGRRRRERDPRRRSRVPADPACRTRAAVNAAALRHRRNDFDHPASALDQLLARRHPGDRAGGLERLRRTAIPIVQCVKVRRAGNPISGLRVELLEVSRRIQSDAACPAALLARSVRSDRGAVGFAGAGARAWQLLGKRAVIAQPNRAPARRREAGCRRAASRAASAEGRDRGPSPRRIPDRGAGEGSPGCRAAREESAPPHTRAPGGASRRSSASAERRPT